MPSTINELIQYCMKYNIPYKRIHFFIGENSTEAKCFGIYKENNTVIVYKNKSDCTRAVRYSGPDEAYAVSIFLDKMLKEVQRRKNNTSTTVAVSCRNPTRSHHRTFRLQIVCAIIVLLQIVGLIFNIFTNSRRPHYYRNGEDYYFSDGTD